MGTEMHDRTAERLAQLLGGAFDRSGSVDILIPDRNLAVEVSMNIEDVRLSIEQVNSFPNMERYIAVPIYLVKDVITELGETDIGVMDLDGRIY